ncbi:MAG: hypothetical protein SFU56_22630 [Capsulimonadales bacterium]|nr:hypothetical protein [Capsulimonadales bacterium]
MRLRSLVLLPATLWLTSAVYAQEAATPPAVAGNEPVSAGQANRRRFSLRIGPDYTIYRPASARTGQRFSGTWRQFGWGWGTFVTPKAGLHSQFNTEFLIGKSGDNRVYLLPVQFGAIQGWKVGSATLYAGLTGGPCGVNLRADPEGVKAGWRVAPSAALTAGANLSRRAYFEMQYYRINPVRGFDFSGTNLSAGFRF